MKFDVIGRGPQYEGVKKIIGDVNWHFTTDGHRRMRNPELTIYIDVKLQTKKQAEDLNKRLEADEDACYLKSKTNGKVYIVTENYYIHVQRDGEGIIKRAFKW